MKMGKTKVAELMKMETPEQSSANSDNIQTETPVIEIDLEDLDKFFPE